MTKTRAKRPLLGNHQNSWLWGSLCLLETLRVGEWPIHELHYDEDQSIEILEEIVTLAQAAKVKTFPTTSRKIEERCKARDHQGVAALMGPFPYASVDSFNLPETHPGRFLIFDRIQDPYNVGTMIRSAAALGMDAILMSTTNQVGVSSHVARSSAGMVNRIPIIRVSQLSKTLQSWQEKGVALLAGLPDAEMSIRQLTSKPQWMNRPLGILVGNEATGVSDELIQLCDLSIKIPMRTDVESLNVAASAAILMHELSPLQ